MQEKELNTELSILNAAKKIFIQKGFDGTKMQDIANEAGINKSLLHYYFRSKDKLFETIFEEAIMQFFPKISDTMASDISFEKKVEAFVDIYITMLQNNPYIPMFILHEINSNPDKIFSLLGKHINYIQNILFGFKKEVINNNIENINAEQLIVNMLSLCIFPVIAKPMLKGMLLNNDEDAYLNFIEQRKKEIPKFIINSLKK